MSSMTAADITLPAIAREEKRVVELQKVADDLRRKFETAAQEAADASTALEWRRILRRIEDDTLLRHCAQTLRSAIEVYDASFREPDGYHNEEEVEYNATDDYADFNVVDQCVDGLLDSMHQQLEVEKHTDRAVLMLLIVSTEIGRIVESAADSKYQGAPVGEIEDCRDSLVSEWQRLFFDENGELGNGVLKKADAIRWHNMVSTHLGAPFDAVPTGA